MIESINEDSLHLESVGQEGIESAQAEAMLESLSGSAGFGPVSIKYSIDSKNLELRFTVSILGMKAGSAVLSPKNTGTTISANIGVAKASARVEVDFRETVAKYEVQGCVRGFTGFKCKKYKGILINW
jgi:hypothetical protein